MPATNKRYKGFTTKKLERTKRKITIKALKDKENGLSGTCNDELAKNDAIAKIKLKKKLKITKIGLIKGKIATKNAITKRSGKTKEKIGITIKFAKTDKKLKLEKNDETKGKIPIWAETETAISWAILFGIILDKSLENGFSKSKIDITQKKDIKNPISTTESGLARTIINPAIASELRPS